MSIETTDEDTKRELAARLRALIANHRARNPDDRRPTRELVQAWIRDRIREGRVRQYGDRYRGRLDEPT
jgi:hypothetical protein